VQVFILWSN